MKHRWEDDDVAGAVAGRSGRTAVLERPEMAPPEIEVETQPLLPHMEHGRETIIAFPGNRALDEGMERLVWGLLADFLEEAPSRGYRNIMVACEEDAPFRPTIESAVYHAGRSIESLNARFTTRPRRVDLYVVLEQAMGRERGGVSALADRLLSQQAPAVLIVAPEDENGMLFFSALSGLLSGGKCVIAGEAVTTPPEPGTDLRISQRMLQILSRTAPA